MMFEPLNILFICSRNKWRSPTAEKIYQRKNMIQVRSAGTSSKARRKVNSNDIKWADIIIVMEKKHRQRLRVDFTEKMKHKEIHILHIEDNYQFMDPELIQEIERGVDAIINGAD